MTWIREHITRRASPAIQRAEQTRRELLDAAERRERQADQAEEAARRRSYAFDVVEMWETGTVREERR